MAIDSLAESVLAEQLSEENMCEWRNGCQWPATYMVWCDHHRKGCDYTGYRCDLHFNMLYRETLRMMQSIKSQWLSLCRTCGLMVEAGEVSDHLRWVRL